MRPTRPRNFPEHAEACLLALADHGLGHVISVGGAFGLLHYLDYRSTHDVDAWWQASASSEDRSKVIRVLKEALEQAGEVKVRKWGEVVSVELSIEDKKRFSFQIADRSVQLEDPIPAPWGDVLLDGFEDLVASKMVALVERGAPRDFRDIFSICRSNLTSPEQCWQLWHQRQARGGLSTDSERARLAVETHLARITTHRPLEKIADGEEREKTADVRRWYKEELLDALVD